MRRRICLLVLLSAASLPFALEAHAQARDIEASGLPRSMVDRLIRTVNDPATHHFRGPTEIPRDSIVPGDMVVSGSLRLAGLVEGDVIVVGGDVELRSGFLIRGDVTVVDGEIRGEDLGRIEGLAAQFSRSMSRTVGGVRITAEEPGVSLPMSRDRDRGASSHFALRAGDFNRVEGLQLLAGPVLTTGGENPFRTTALLIWRAEGAEVPLGVDRTGFRVEMEQFLGGRREWRIGGGVHSMVSPVEAGGLSDRENAWSSFLMTTDYRDHYERRGWQAFVRATPRSLPLDVSLEFHREEHGTVAAGNPWSVFQRDRAWREQPLTAEGSTRALVARAAVDTRDRRREPGSGWFVEGTVRKGLGGSLAVPSGVPVGPPEPGGPGPFIGPELDARFTTGVLDVRRYNTVGRGTRFNLRGVVGGSLDDGLLPPQYQHALGGAGSLPGHPRFTADCGSREALIHVDSDSGEGAVLRPYYGCDRFALVQAEYRGSLNLRTGFGLPDAEDYGGGHRHHPKPSWVVFFNAGRGWSNGDWGDLSRVDSPPLYDAGIGLILGEGGIYWAVPLGEHGEGSRIHIRLERRF
jgi:hypothetical protein